MTASAQSTTRAVSISAQDILDLRSELKTMSEDQKSMVGYLVDRAEAGAASDTRSDDLWTWTYRF